MLHNGSVYVTPLKHLHHERDPLANRLLGLKPPGHVSRPWCLSYAIGVAGWLFVASVFPTQAQTWSSPHLGGYLSVSYTRVANTYNAGYSMYVAQLGRPQYAYYSPNFQASFQIGT